MARDIMIVPISIKGLAGADGDNFIIDMLAAVYNNMDLGRDKILPGAFTKTLKEKGNERPILWQHQISEPIGKGAFSDTMKGLAARALLPKNDSLVSGRVMPQVNVGSIQGASIGYETIDSDYDNANKIRNLKTLDLFETSLVTIPMNPLAQILSVTKAAENMGVCEYKGMDRSMKNYIYELMEQLEDKKKIGLLPTTDDRTTWDEKKALKDIQDHNGGEECYFGKFPIAYFEEGAFKAVPKGISSSIAKMMNENASKEIKDRANAYYKKLGRDHPFSESGKFLIDTDIVKFFSGKQLAMVIDGDQTIELTRGSKDYLMKCFKGQSIDSRNEETGKKSAILEDFFKTLKDFNLR